MKNSEARHIVFFDGVCNLCNGAVQFIIKRDRHAIFHFSALQSAAGQRALQRFGLPADHFESFLLLENNRLYTQSTAALRVCRQLNGLWKLLYVFIIIPPFIRDIFYSFIARNRYQWFGRRESCMMPDIELSHRFLSDGKNL